MIILDVISIRLCSRSRMRGRMKKISIMLAVLLLLSVSADADTYVKIKEHRDEYYHHGTVDPAEDDVTELWIGDGRMAMIDGDRHVIIDREKGKLFVIEFTDTAYVETALPFTLADLVPEEFIPRLAMFPTVGEVKDLGETKKIDGRECSAYQLNSWVMYQGTKFNETERKVWATRDIPFDGQMASEYIGLLCKFSNFGEDLLEQVMAIDGFELLSEGVRYAEGQAINSSRKVVEMEEKDPPHDVYTVTNDYRKKDKISVR